VRDHILIGSVTAIEIFKEFDTFLMNVDHQGVLCCVCVFVDLFYFPENFIGFFGLEICFDTLIWWG